MNIMNKLTLKHMKQNKTRTFFTLVGIIISVAMLTAVSTGVTSAMRWLQNCEMDSSGRWLVSYLDVSGDKYSVLVDEYGQDNISVLNEIGYTELPESQNAYKPYLFVLGLNKEAMANMKLTLVEGRLPENETEIIISRHILIDGGVEYQVGDTLSFDLKNRYNKDTNEQLRQNQQYMPLHEELRSIGEKKEYKIVGIIERPNYHVENYVAPGYSVITYLDSSKLTAQTTVNFDVYDDSMDGNFYDQCFDMMKQLNLVNGETSIQECNNVDLNQQVLYYAGLSLDDRFSTFLITISAILIIIIVIGSVSLIYNAFGISISERSKQLGMIASIGATKKQKRNSVFFEAFLYTAVGIPMGILSGIVGLKIAFQAVGPMLSEGFGTSSDIAMYFNRNSIIAAILFSIMTIFISAYIPAIRASRIAPIEAIRQIKDIKLTRKEVKCSWITKKLFGFEGELALKNMKRNRKRYRSLVFSLFISVVLFISVSSYIYYVRASYVEAKSSYNYDITVYGSDFDDAIAKKMFRELKESNAVEEVALSKMMSGWQMSEGQQKFITEEARKIYKETYMEEKEYLPYICFVVLDEQQLKDYCSEIDLEYNIFSKSEGETIVLNYIREDMGSTIATSTPLNVKKGDSIGLTCDYSVGDEENPEYRQVKDEIRIAAVTNELPFGVPQYTNSYYDSITMIVSEQTMNQLNQTLESEDTGCQWVSNSIFMFTNDNEEAVTKVKNFIEQASNYSIDMYDVNEKNQSTEKLVLAVSVFAYGFIILISLICCANMCNTISTSVQLRRKEFAMLKSVGMTPHTFRRMIMYESLLYGVKALMYGIPVSMLFSYLIYRVVNNQFSIAFDSLLGIYLFAVVIIFVVVGLAMMYASRKVRKENIITGLKDQNF